LYNCSYFRSLSETSFLPEWEETIDYQEKSIELPLPKYPALNALKAQAVSNKWDSDGSSGIFSAVSPSPAETDQNAIPSSTPEKYPIFSTDPTCPVSPIYSRDGEDSSGIFFTPETIGEPEKRSSATAGPTSSVSHIYLRDGEGSSGVFLNPETTGEPEKRSSATAGPTSSVSHIYLRDGEGSSGVFLNPERTGQPERKLSDTADSTSSLSPNYVSDGEGSSGVFLAPKTTGEAENRSLVTVDPVSPIYIRNIENSSRVSWGGSDPDTYLEARNRLIEDGLMIVEESSSSNNTPPQPVQKEESPLPKIICPALGCEQMFSTTYNMNIHYSTVHLGLAAYTCCFCPWKESHRSRLSRHLRAAHDIEQPSDEMLEKNEQYVLMVEAKRQQRLWTPNGKY
jgi:hypothetical protein